MFDVVGKHSKANRYTTIKGLTEGQLGAEVVKGIIEQIQCVGHLQLHGLVIYTVGPTAEVLLFWKTMPCYDGPQASTLTAGPLARRLFLLGGPVRASGSSTPLARRDQRAYVRATRVFVLRWPEVKIRSRRRRHLSCFLAVGSFPSSFPANDKLIR